MKKLLAMLLAALMVFALAACAEESNDVSSTSSAAGVSSEAPVSSEEASSEAESSESVTPSEEPSEAPSEEPSEPSEDTSSEDEEVLEAPALINKFVSIGTVSTKDSATGTNALPLTGVDVEPAYGAMILYTAEYGVLDAEELAEFAVVAFAYDHEYFGYVKTAFYEVGEAEEISADEDGFVLAIHSSQETFIPRARDIKDGTTVFPHGG